MAIMYAVDGRASSCSACISFQRRQVHDWRPVLKPVIPLDYAITSRRRNRISCLCQQAWQQTVQCTAELAAAQSASYARAGEHMAGTTPSDCLRHDGQEVHLASDFVFASRQGAEVPCAQQGLQLVSLPHMLHQAPLAALPTCLEAAEDVSHDPAENTPFLKPLPRPPPTGSEGLKQAAWPA